MSDDVALRLLHGGATEIQELDPEEQENNDSEALIDYETYVFTESIGGEDFENNYYLFINEIKNQEIRNLKVSLNRILEKVNDIYDFSFSEELDLNVYEERNWLLDFIKFIEFDNLEFLASLYENMELESIKDIKDLDEYLENNSKLILFTIQSMEMIYTYNKLILDFFLNYNEQSFIRWLIKQTKKHKYDIELKLKTIEGEENV